MSDPSAGSHPAWPALEKGALWDHDPRLQAAWNHYSVCRHEHPRRQRDRRLHAHPQSLGLDSVSQTHSPPHAAGQATPSDHGQLRGPQGPRGADVAGPPQALSRALRPYQFFLAEHARTLLSRSDGEAHQRGVFHSVAELQQAIREYMTNTTASPSRTLGQLRPGIFWKRSSGRGRNCGRAALCRRAESSPPWTVSTSAWPPQAHRTPESGVRITPLRRGFETHPCQRQTTSRPKSILPIAWHARHRCRPSRFHRTTPFSCDTPYWSDSYSSEAG